jgi:hypothetical protein
MEMYLTREERNTIAFNSAQSRYENAMPVEAEEMPESVKAEKFCDYLAQQWVKDGGDLVMFRRWSSVIPCMIDSGCFNEVTHPADHCAFYCKDNGWQGSVFSYYAKEISGWIAAYMSAYGRIGK